MVYINSTFYQNLLILFENLHKYVFVWFVLMVPSVTSYAKELLLLLNTIFNCTHLILFL